MVNDLKALFCCALFIFLCDRSCQRLPKAGVKKVPNTKIELNHNKIARIQGLDELAKALFYRDIQYLHLAFCCDINKFMEFCYEITHLTL